MELLFENKTDFKADKKLLDMFEGLICDSLEHEGVPTEVQVGLTLVEKNEIRELNRKFRNIDKETDVLSFPLYDFNTEKPDFKKGTVCLGDIVNCVSKAVEQSKEYGHSFEREMGFLTVHSMLHLMGYDHMTAEEENIMFAKQEEILKKAGLNR